MARGGHPLRVLLVSNYYPEHMGGIETAADGLARHYRGAGYRVRWCAAEPQGLPHRGHPDDLPLPAWNWTERHLGFPYPMPGLGSYLTLVREIKACDAIHVHDCLYLASAFTAAVAGLLRKPVLITQHVGPIPYRRRALRLLQAAAYATLGRLVLSGAGRVAFISAEVHDWFSTFVRFRGTPELIENGVDLQCFAPADDRTRASLRTRLGLAPQAPVILFVGRFIEKKGVGLLREVIAGNPAWSWVLIGRPDSVDPSGWRLPNLRVVAPVSPDVLRDYYAAADLLVLPSVGEGFPLVVQEAMACGTPAIVSEEVTRVIPAARPLLFSTRRESDAIAAATDTALIRLRETPDLRIQVAQFARQRWSWAAIGARYAALLESLAMPPTAPAEAA